MSIEPGLSPDLPEAQYHADRSALSVSGAKNLLPPSCPAKFKWMRDNPQPSKRDYDFGHAAHKAVLGVGAEVVVVQKVTRDKVKVDATDYQTKSAQEHRDAIYAEGKVPLLAAEVAQVDGMTKALLDHPIASALFDPSHGKPEASLYWHDERFDINRRGRLDWLPESDGGRMIVPDYKTTPSADPVSFSKSVASFGYHMQADFYMEGVRALGLAEDVNFVFVVQEKTAPYLVTVYELDADALTIGRRMNNQACHLFAQCTATDTWPGYGDDIGLLSLPSWYIKQNEAVL